MLERTSASKQSSTASGAQRAAPYSLGTLGIARQHANEAVAMQAPERRGGFGEDAGVGDGREHGLGGAVRIRDHGCACTRCGHQLVGEGALRAVRTVFPPRLAGDGVERGGEVLWNRGALEVPQRTRDHSAVRTRAAVPGCRRSPPPALVPSPRRSSTGDRYRTGELINLCGDTLRRAPRHVQRYVSSQPPDKRDTVVGAVRAFHQSQHGGGGVQDPVQYVRTGAQPRRGGSVAVRQPQA